MPDDPSPLDSFRARLAEDESLQQEVRACSDVAAVVALAERAGFEFSADRVESLLSSGELSDVELELVAGGGSPVECKSGDL